MISEAERRAFIAKRRPMTKEELADARDVLCKYVEPETSVAYHFILLLVEVERAQAVDALRAKGGVLCVGGSGERAPWCDCGEPPEIHIHVPLLAQLPSPPQREPCACGRTAETGCAKERDRLRAAEQQRQPKQKPLNEGDLCGPIPRTENDHE